MGLKRSTEQLQLLLAGGLWLLSLLTFYAGLLPRLEYQFLDWSLRSLAARHTADADIVIIDIDEPSLAAMTPEYGRYPWSRAVYGSLLEGLARQQPAAIVFDILFTDPQLDHEQDDLYFIEVVRAGTHTYFPMVRLPATAEVDREHGYPLKLVPGAIPPSRQHASKEARAALLLPLPGLAETGRIGTIDVDPDFDGILRRYPLYRTAAGWRLPSLPTRVAQDLGFPLPAEQPWLLLAWRGSPGSFTSVPFFELYTDIGRQRPQRPAEEFSGKIVIIGTTAPGLYDTLATPVGNKFPGVEVLATALDNLKHGDAIRVWPLWTGLLLTGAVLWILALAFRAGVGLVPAGVGLMAVSASLLAGAWLLTVAFQRHVPVVASVIFGWLYYLPVAINAYLRERGQRRRVTQIFSRFLDPRVVSELIDQGETTSTLTGQKREVTVLFSDIRAFTTLSETQPPQAIVDLLNRYFARQVEVIYRHQGTLDKYIGDGIMAFWGAPADQPEHAARAVAAARDMVAALEAFRAELGETGEGFDIGIGIHTGEAVVGFIGSPKHRQDYTVIGDTVNTASRIEGKTRGRCRVLVSATTRQACGSLFEFRDRGRAKLKGRTKEVRLYEPLWS
jgi:adenylate cyclase